MFYSMPVLLQFRVACEIITEEMQDFAVTAVANSMHIDLEACLQHRTYFFGEEAILLAGHTDMSFSVTVLF